MLIQFTIKDNEKIRNFLNGDDSDPPTSELIYLHSHPLIRPSFLTEIESLVLEASAAIQAKKLQGKVLEDFTRLAITIGTQLPDITQSNALSILLAIREIYQLSNKLIGMK